MRVLRIARVLKLLKMATGMRALLDTVMQALPQVGNLGLLFMLLFFIYAALGVELFGRLECSEKNPCEGLSRHATFENFGMAFLTLFRVSTGDNWNGIMKDTLRECHDDSNCLAYLPWVSPLYFVTFVLMAQFVLVNVVVAVLMKHLEESNKEAKEDAEMDAEIAMEIALERQRKLSTTSSNSSGDGTFVGPCPNSPGEDEEEQCDDRDVQSPLRMSVSRMHSLPNDSYMFRPVRPASAPYPLEEVDTNPPDRNSGSLTSVNSQPCEGRTLLQVPDVSPSHPRQRSLHLPCIAPPTSSPSPRALRRQVAVKVDSVESQSCEQQERPNSAHPPPRSPFLAGPPSPSLLSSPGSLPPQPSSPSILLPPPPSPRLPLRPASLRRPRPPSAVSFCDPADEEVCHITTSAHQRSQSRGEEERVRENRSHSLSPYTSPLPPALSSSSSQSTFSLLGAGLKERKGFGGEVPQQPALLSAGYPDDQRRHSIEVCLPQGPTLGSGRQEEPPPEKGGFPMRVQSFGGGHRKKKMSPPCISIHPPCEKEPPQVSSPPKLADSSTMLRRRTPSYDLTPHTQDAFAEAPVMHALLPSRGSTPTHAPTPTRPHIPISPNVFIQPHAPLVPTTMPFSASASPVAGRYIPLPQFTFNHPQSRHMSETEVATCSSPFDSNLGGGAGFHAKNRRTAQ